MTTAIQTNTGLHGNMLFYEMDHRLQFTAPTEPIVSPDRDSIHFEYVSHDSDEGVVEIVYWSISGNVDDPDGGWDVQIKTASDVWDLERTQQAVNEAIRLHRHLGQHTPFAK